MAAFGQKRTLAQWLKTLKEGLSQKVISPPKLLMETV